MLYVLCMDISRTKFAGLGLGLEPCNFKYIGNCDNGFVLSKNISLLIANLYF